MLSSLELILVMVLVPMIVIVGTLVEPALVVTLIEPSTLVMVLVERLAAIVVVVWLASLIEIVVRSVLALVSSLMSLTLMLVIVVERFTLSLVILRLVLLILVTFSGKESSLVRFHMLLRLSDIVIDVNIIRILFILVFILFVVVKVIVKIFIVVKLFSVFVDFDEIIFVLVVVFLDWSFLGWLGIVLGLLAGLEWLLLGRFLGILLRGFLGILLGRFDHSLGHSFFLNLDSLALNNRLLQLFKLVSVKFFIFLFLIFFSFQVSWIHEFFVVTGLEKSNQMDISISLHDELGLVHK